MLELNTIVLRPFRETDLSFVLAVRNDLEIETAAYPCEPRPQLPADLRRRYFEGHSAPSSGGDNDVEFVVATVEDERTPVGIAGMYGVDRHNGIGEIGVTIGDRGQWGTGAGFDAHLALIEYGFTYLGLQRIYGQVKSDNRGVLKLCERLGMTREGTLRRHRWKAGNHVDLVVFGLLKEEYDPGLRDWRASRA